METNRIFVPEKEAPAKWKINAQSMGILLKKYFYKCNRKNSYRYSK
jgi:phage pi2 protein 07